MNSSYVFLWFEAGVPCKFEIKHRNEFKGQKGLVYPSLPKHVLFRCDNVMNTVPLRTLNKVINKQLKTHFSDLELVILK